MKQNSILSVNLPSEISHFVDSSTSFSVIGVPGVGISIFLKNIASTLQSSTNIYIDVFGLSSMTTESLFTLILEKLGGNAEKSKDVILDCQKVLLDRTKSGEKIVFFFGGFDQLKDSFNEDFFQSLRALRNTDRKNVVFVFGICRRIETLINEKLMDIELGMFSNIYYLKPYTLDETNNLLTLYGPSTNKAQVENLHRLSGGHFQLLQLLLRNEGDSDPTKDQFVQLALKNIYDHLNFAQKKSLQKMVSNRPITNVDNYLVKIGLVKITTEGMYELFSPLFTSFVESQSGKKIPAKEAKLFQLLKNNLEKVVTKDEIFKKVWGEEEFNASDWALDSLIYRLRKNKTFIAKGYAIESYKKQGYMLINS